MSATPGFFVILGLLHTYQAKSQSDCELRKSKDSIFVYACPVTDSNLKSIKAEFSLPTNLSILAGHILDIESYTQWQYNIIKTQVLKRVSDNEIIYRAEVHAPWPVSNRDLVVRLKITQDPLTKEMYFSIISIPDYIPEYKGIVRVPRSEGKWIITPGGTKELRIQYSFLVDPGGSIPAWLLNMTIAEGPYNTFKNLTDRIKSGIKVQPASFITD